MTDSKHRSPQGMGFDTLSLHAGQVPDPTTGARATPIYQSAAFVFPDSDAAAGLFNIERAGHVYSRLSNPTNAVLEERMAAHPDWIGYLITQEPEYRELKERCAAAAVRGEFPEGVATIEIAIEALKLAKYLTPLLSARLG